MYSLKFLDVFFVIFHTSLIVFNLLGWIFKTTRKINLIILLLTGISWFVLGLKFGIGYCPFTDFHWKVLHKLGHQNLPNSYIEYLLERITGINFKAGIIDPIVLIGFFVAITISIFLNLKDFSKNPVKGK